jgi:hypothetical protein
MYFGLTILAGACRSNVTNGRRQNLFKIILGMPPASELKA